MPLQKKIFQTRYQLAAILILTIVIFLNTLPNEFVFDDHDFIENWQEIKTFKNIPAFFKGIMPVGHEGVYRPLKGVYLATSYKVFGANPVGYHIQALLVHLASTLLVFLLILNLTKNDKLALIATLLFGIHPIHTEAITFMTASFDTIGLMFVFASFLLYLKSEIYQQKKKHTIKHFLFFSGSTFCAWLAYLSYEMALILPLLLFAHGIYFAKQEQFEYLLKIQAPYLLGVFVFVIIRFGILTVPSRGEYLGGNIFFTFITMTKAFVKYILLLFYPVNLTINHKLAPGVFGIIPTTTKQAILDQSILDPLTILGTLILIGLLYLCYSSWKKEPLVGFSIVWFFAALLPVSNIIPSSTVIVGERYLYLASLGFCILCAYYFLLFMDKNKKHKKQILICSILLILILSGLTIYRNAQWKNDLVFWQATVEATPDNSYAHRNLGIQFEINRELGKTIEEYKTAIELNPKEFQSYTRLAGIYQNLGQERLAQDVYARLEKHVPKGVSHDLNVVLPEDLQGKIDISIATLKNRLKGNPKDIQAQQELGKIYENLGALYQRKGMIDKAQEHYHLSIGVNPKNVNALNGLAVMADDQGDTEQAKYYIREILKIEPSNQMALQNLQTLESR